MKTREISDLFNRFEAAAAGYEGVECWSARELQHLLGYSNGRISLKLSKRQRILHKRWRGSSDHFPDVRKMVQIRSGAEKEINDLLTLRLLFNCAEWG